MLRAVSRHVAGANWREAARVFRTVVERAKFDTLDKDQDKVKFVIFSFFL